MAKAATALSKRSRNPRGQGARLRTEIVEAAIRILAAANTPAPLSLREVAREIGVAPQSVYLHFPDKTALLYAVVEELFDELQRRLDQEEAGETDPRSRLRARGRGYLAYAAENPGHYKLLFESQIVTAIGGYEGSPGHRVFEALVETTHASMPRRTAAEAKEVAFAMWCGLHGIASLRWSKPGMPWPAVDRLVSRLEDGLLARARSAPRR
jgi:AcrR family transcriptional regulator